MTCIVGLVDGEDVYLGGDSCGSDGYTYDQSHSHKVFTNGEALIGCTGTFRLIDLLTFSVSIDPPREDDDPEKYIRTDFLGNIRSSFKDNGYIKTNDNGIEEFSGRFLLGWRGRLWEFQHDLSVIPTPELGSAVGSGSTAARGALYATRDNPSPAERVLAALTAAEAVVTTVRGPHVVWRLDGETREASRVISMSL